MAVWPQLFEEVPDLRADMTILRADGELGMVRMRYSGHQFGTVAYEIVQDQVGLARDGLVRETDVFEVDDPAATELYETYVAHLRQARVFAEFASAQDWDGLRPMYADDFSQTDYRDEVSAPPIVGGQAFVDHMQETFAPVRDLQATLDVIAVDGNRRVGRIAYRGHNEEVHDVEFEVVFWTVTTIDGMRLLQSDLYESEEAARAALTGGGGPLARPAILDASDRLLGAFNDRDWEAFGAVLADDLVWTDERPGFLDSAHGREAWVAWAQRMVRDDMEWTYETLDVRGSVVLSQMRFTGSFRGGPFENVMLGVTAVDDEGRIVRSHAFDEKQLDEARARLEALATPAVVEAYGRLIATFNARDWETFAPLFAADFAWQDHRPAFLDSTHGREAFVTWASQMATGELRWDYEALEVRERAMLARVQFTGTYKGGPFENVIYDVHAIGPDGLFTSADTYGDNQLAEAHARLDELSALRAPAAGG